MLTEHPPTVFSNIQGLYSRGNDDACPQDHLLTATNIDFSKGDTRTRKGSVLDYTLPNIKRIRLFKKSGEATRIIILDNLGRLFDASVSLAVPILTIGGMSDFALFTYFNRAYISPSNGTTGLSGEKLYVYDGVTCRAAAGSAPAPQTFGFTNTPGGNINYGPRYITVVFETASGFITKMPYFGDYLMCDTFYNLSDDSVSVRVTGIQLGPVGTVARHLVVSTVQDALEVSPATPIKRPEECEFFFVPNGRIGDNTTDEITINYFETDLVDSADDLIDQYEEIPAGVGMTDYNGRLCVYGVDGSENQVLVSKPGEPESFSMVDGFITTDQKDSSGIRNCREMRGQFYIFKSLQCYTTQDNGETPDTWNPIPVDKGFGAESEGIADVLDAKGAVSDILLIANRNGLVAFNGSFVMPELTWKIEAVWKRITKTDFNKVQVLLDQINHFIYVAVPLDGAPTPNCLLVGYYESEISATSLKWSVWYFDHDPTCISVDVDFNTLVATFRYASGEGNVYKFSDSATDDNGVAYSSSIKTAYIPALDDSGILYQVGGLRARVKGSGVLNISISGIDNAQTVNVPAWTLIAAPGMDYARQCDFTNERAAITLSMTSVNEYFILSRLAAFTKPVWFERPA